MHVQSFLPWYCFEKECYTLCYTLSGVVGFVSGFNFFPVGLWALQAGSQGFDPPHLHFSLSRALITLPPERLLVVLSSLLLLRELAGRPLGMARRPKSSASKVVSLADVRRSKAKHDPYAARKLKYEAASLEIQGNAFQSRHAITKVRSAPATLLQEPLSPRHRLSSAAAL